MSRVDRDPEAIARELEAWCADPYRKPLLLSGSDQAMLDAAARSFAESRFERHVCVNLDDAAAREVFADALTPEAVLGKLGRLCGVEIDPVAALVLLLNGNKCTRAITALKYLKEDMRCCRVICTCNLRTLEYRRDEPHSFPVGCVDTIEVADPLTIEVIAEVVGEVALHYDIERAWLFGSFARGEADAQSDIDLCLETGPDFSLFDAGGVGWAVERELGRRVDIPAEDTMYPHVRESFLEDRVLLFERDGGVDDERQGQAGDRGRDQARQCSGAHPRR